MSRNDFLEHLDFAPVLQRCFTEFTAQKNEVFHLRISSVNVTRSAGNIFCAVFTEGIL